MNTMTKLAASTEEAWTIAAEQVRISKGSKCTGLKGQSPVSVFTQSNRLTVATECLHTPVKNPAGFGDVKKRNPVKIMSYWAAHQSIARLTTIHTPIHTVGQSSVTS